MTNPLSQIILTTGDITDLAVDAVVNAANNDLILGGGVAGAIRAKGGPKIQEECNKISPIPVGDAAITAGGNLKAKYVIHAASMALGGWTTAESLKQSVQSSLKLTAQHKIKTVAFPAIGTGVAGFPPDQCAKIMVDTISAYLQTTSHLEKVYLVLYDRKTFQIFKEYYDSITKS